MKAFLLMLFLVFAALVMVTVPISVVADDGLSPAYTPSLEDATVEILGGTFTGPSGTVFVVVDDAGNIELYCSTETAKLGGLPGEIVHLLDGSTAVLTVACLSPDLWRTQHRLSG